MRYYVDFDRTVFDTESFKDWVRDIKGHGELKSCPREDLSPMIGELIRSGVLSFEAGELSRFVFPDAATFLREKENAVTIITFGDPFVQEYKAKNALYGIPRMSIMYTGDIRKGNYLAPHTHLHEGACMVDDTPLELEILASECPKLALFEMRRDGGEGDGRWPVVRTLSELP